MASKGTNARRGTRLFAGRRSFTAIKRRTEGRPSGEREIFLKRFRASAAPHRLTAVLPHRPPHFPFAGLDV